jgi:hypothetical protein
MAVNPSGGASRNGERDPRLDRLYREGARETPPAHLDAAILAAARREGGAGPRRLSARLRAWRVPVSIAAVVVLTVSLVTLVGEESGERYLSSDRAVPGPARPAEPAPPAVVMKQPPAAESAPRPAPTQADPMRFSRKEAASAEPEAPGASAAGSARPGGVPAMTGAAEADAGSYSPLLRDSMRAAGERAAAPQSPAADEPVTGASGIAARRDAPAAAAPAPSRAVSGSVRAKVEPAEKRAPAWHGLEAEPPAKWLERAIALKREGRAAEYQELLAEFKRRFPEHPVPPELE